MLEALILEMLGGAAATSAVSAGAAAPAAYQCFMHETERQGIQPILLLAVLKTEGGKVGTLSKNSNGSIDLGIGQVNTIHLANIARITGLGTGDVASKLAYDACSNLAASAWLLRSAINDAGGDVWKGVGYYHSHTPNLGNPYAWRVYGNMKVLYARAMASPAVAFKSAEAAVASNASYGAIRSNTFSGVVAAETQNGSSNSAQAPGMLAKNPYLVRQ